MKHEPIKFVEADPKAPKFKASYPKISVVMPVYNVEKYVAEAIQSVLDQSFTRFELIIVDDGGNDNSMDIVRGFDDPRITIITQENRGLAGARNTGILHSNGKYIAFLDSDDRWHKEKLALHFIHLEHNAHVDMSYSASRLICEDGKPMAVVMNPGKGIEKPQRIFLRNPVGNGSAPVIRRSTLDRIAFHHPEDELRLCWFDESFRQSEDIECWVRLAIQGGANFEGIDAQVTFYRVASDGLSANIDKQYASWQAMVTKLRGYAPAFAERYYRAAHAYQLRYYARRAISMGDSKAALKYMWQATKESRSIYIFEPKKSFVTLFAALFFTVFGTTALKRAKKTYLINKGAA
ncbi:hypothetical protein LPB140_01160 [Sphingorhabdus lutea]|uniref:Glycosyltransferase 2-like domain-containing protein n=1 Tax=Sphingorhabdus lutea TaxID=1913578 RepID=A0A1L3J955_9SPHN|nr:glycosyltransferase family A protein [Sphingorhabdus lutea]APG61672.1 hypothetical protein LPB140_01160 [Sphingorhabdus lutea]